MVTTAPFNDGPDRRAITVGTEFVRQYYTVLNSNPSCVHRFYSGDSAFVYGGVDRPGHEELPVRGQNNIHQRISEIGFKDPRCKILQIDAMFSEAECVLVQACGELSNDGGPMRRFMQSFLLKPKGEKAYYVLNSIFRYQDEVFGDDMDDGGSSNIDEHHVGLDTENELDMADTDTSGNETAPGTAIIITDSLQQFQNESVLPPPGYEILPQNSTIETFNGEINDDNHVDIKSPALEPEGCVAYNETIEKTTEKNADEKVDDSVDLPNEISEVEIRATSPLPEASTKPKSWAAMFSTANHVRPTSATTVVPTGQPTNDVHRSVTATQAPILTKTDRQQTLTKTSQNAGIVEKDNQRRSLQPNGNINGTAAVTQERSTNGRGAFSSKQNTPTREHDAFQIFVGNLSPTLTEPELQEFFCKFGEVESVRINQGNTNKFGPKREGVVPNFGFVIFRDRGTVQNVLDACPISIGERRVNVEEKKMQQQNLDRGNRAGNNRSGVNQRRGGGSSRGGLNSDRNNGLVAAAGGRGVGISGGQRF